MSAWGDTLYGITLFLIIKGFDLRTFLLFLLFCLTGALIFVAVLVTFHSLSFFSGNTEGLAQLTIEFLISFSIYPEGIFYKGLKKYESGNLIINKL